MRILSFFSDTPRALATDGTTVYVAAFHSGNQTTPILEANVPNTFASTCGGGGVGTGMPGPADNAAHAAAPPTGIIVKRSGANWVDSLGCTWNSAVPFTLPGAGDDSANALWTLVLDTQVAEPAQPAEDEHSAGDTRSVAARSLLLLKLKLPPEAPLWSEQR